MYEYRCVIKRIVDGDTVDVDIDLGFEVWLVNRRIRITNIDTPEVRTRDAQEKTKGLEASARAEVLLPIGSKQTLLSKDWQGKYGRIIGDFVIDETTFSETMLNEGYASPYEG